MDAERVELEAHATVCWPALNGAEDANVPLLWTSNAVE